MINIPIIRPGDPSVQTEDMSYEEYEKGTAAYFEKDMEEAERASQISSRIRRGRLGQTKDRRAKIAWARRQRELKKREGVLKEKDTPEYAEAEAARPVYTGSGWLTHSKKLNKWIEKYQPILGRTPERYEKEKTFLEEQQQEVKTGSVKEELSPYGLGRDITNLTSDTKYEVVERYASGKPKKIRQKPEKYISREDQKRGGKSQYTYKEYVPYEAELNIDGTLKSELNRDIVKTKWNVNKSSDDYHIYTPIIKGELTYEAGKPKSLIGRSTYRSEHFQDDKTIRAYTDYTPYESSKVTFSDKGTVEDKKVFGIGRTSSHGIDKWGGIFHKKPYEQKHYEFGDDGSVNWQEFGKPWERETRSGKYYKDLAAKNVQPSIKRVNWWNPYKGKGSPGISGPIYHKIKGQGYAIPLEESGKWISHKVHPVLNRPFVGQIESQIYWGTRQARKDTVLGRQQDKRELKKVGGVIPPSYFGKTSEKFGQVSPEGLVIKTPTQLRLGDWYLLPHKIRM